MRAFLMTTVAMASVVPSLAIAQDRTSQPPMIAGEATQTASGQGPKSSSDVDAGAQTLNATGLGEIIVTAQRKSESAQRAAIAISVIGGADLVNNGISQPDRLNSLVPALTISNVGPSATSFIRGVGNFSVAVTSDPAVAFNYDGVYIGRFTATSTTFFDLDRVEVLKGPQGTLYGRNATAGAINILPTQPKLGQFTGYAAVQYGDYNAFSAEGAVNVPIGENGAARISGIVNRRDGYNSDGSSDDKSEGIRVQVKSNLTPNLTARVSVDYEHLGGQGTGLSFLNTYACSATTVGTPGATPNCIVKPTNIPRGDGNTSPASQAFWTSLNSGVTGRLRDPFPANYQNSTFYGSNADIEWKTDAGTLTVIPAVRFDHVQNRNPGGGFPIANDQKDIQYSAETRFGGKVSLFDYTLGFFYFNENVNLRAGTITNNSSGNFPAPAILDTESYAPFLRLTAHLTPKLRLVGGVRYTHDNRQFNAHYITIAETCARGFTCPTAILPTSVPFITSLPFAIPTTQSASPLVPVTIAGPTPNTIISRSDIFFNNRLSEGKVTWRAAAEYDLTSTSLLYASAERGFRSGGFNTAVVTDPATAPIPSVYQPEYLTAYTLGSKNRFFDNRAQVNIEAFYWKYENQQVAHAAVDQINRPGSYTQNIGRSTIKGVEVEGRVLVTSTTQLTADVQYLDAHDDSFTYLTVGYPYTNCGVAGAGATTTGLPLFTVNCSGLPGYNSPRWSLNLSAQQTVPVGNYKLVLTADTQYKTSRYTYFDYATEQLQRASFTTYAQASFGPANGQWSASVFVRNIENNRLLAAPVAFGGNLAAYLTPPRTFGGRVSYKF